MSNKTFHYRQEEEQVAGVVEVSEKQVIAAPDALMVFDSNDIINLYRYIQIPISKFGQPDIKIENDVEVALIHGNVKNFMSRNQWTDFVEAVNAVELPLTEMPAEVEVEIEVQMNHTFTLDIEELLGDDERYSEDGWAGNAESMADAIRDAANDRDWYGEIRYLMVETLDYVDVTDTHPSYH